MRGSMAILLVTIAVAGCSSQGASKGTVKPTPEANVVTGGTPSPTRVTITPPTAQTARTSPASTRTPVVQVSVSPTYSSFLTSVCHAFAARDTATLTGFLPYYQYNSGLRYGTLGDGEGQTADPSLLGSWLQNAHVVCRSFTADRAGHGTLLTSGWTQSGGWSLIDLDTYNGTWKFNDFTFGGQAALTHAMHTSRPVMTYHGA